MEKCFRNGERSCAHRNGRRDIAWCVESGKGGGEQSRWSIVDDKRGRSAIGSRPTGLSRVAAKWRGSPEIEGDARIRNWLVLSPARHREYGEGGEDRGETRRRVSGPARGLSTLSPLLLRGRPVSSFRVPKAKNKVSKVTAKRKQHETRVKILALRRMLVVCW